MSATVFFGGRGVRELGIQERGQMSGHMRAPGRYAMLVVCKNKCLIIIVWACDGGRCTGSCIPVRSDESRGL